MAEQLSRAIATPDVFDIIFLIQVFCIFPHHNADKSADMKLRAVTLIIGAFLSIIF